MPRAADSVEQGQPQYADYAEQIGERGMGSLERECGSLETCGLCDWPDLDSDLFG